MTYRIIAAVAIGIIALAPIRASAEVLTTKIGDRTLTYVVTAGQKGPGKSREEILNLLSTAKPSAPVLKERSFRAATP